MSPESSQKISWFHRKHAASFPDPHSAIRILPADEAGTSTRLNSLVQHGLADVMELFRWAAKNIKTIKIQPAKKRLRVCESVSLGEKRFIAVVQLDGKEFLVGGAPNSLSLLAATGKPVTFSDVLKENYAQDWNQA
jgi:hypothetical protein